MLTFKSCTFSCFDIRTFYSPYDSPIFGHFVFFANQQTHPEWPSAVTRPAVRNFSSMHVKPKLFFPHSRCFRAAESWNHQSGKEPMHRCPRLAGNCTKRLRQIFFLSSPTSSWRASRVQVRLRIRGRQRRWRKSSMAGRTVYFPPNAEERDEHTQSDLWEDGFGTAVIPVALHRTRRSRKQQRPDRSDKTPRAQASNAPSCLL